MKSTKILIVLLLSLSLMTAPLHAGVMSKTAKLAVVIVMGHVIKVAVKAAVKGKLSRMNKKMAAAALKKAASKNKEVAQAIIGVGSALIVTSPRGTGPFVGEIMDEADLLTAADHKKIAEDSREFIKATNIFSDIANSLDDGEEENGCDRADSSDTLITGTLPDWRFIHKPVQIGDVGSYRNLTSWAEPRDALEHDHIPSGADLIKFMKKNSAQYKEKIHSGKVKDNGTAIEVHESFHADRCSGKCQVWHHERNMPLLEMVQRVPYVAYTIKEFTVMTPMTTEEIAQKRTQQEATLKESYLKVDKGEMISFMMYVIPGILLAVSILVLIVGYIFFGVNLEYVTNGVQIAFILLLTHLFISDFLITSRYIEPHQIKADKAREILGDLEFKELDVCKEMLQWVSADFSSFCDYRDAVIALGRTFTVEEYKYWSKAHKELLLRKAEELTLAENKTHCEAFYDPQFSVQAS